MTAAAMSYRIPVAVKSPERTVAAVVRQQTGVAWSRARRLCTEGRVTVNGQRCLDPASRVAPGTVVVVDQRAPKLRPGPLAESAIVFYDRDVVVVDKPVGMLSVADEPGNKDTLVDYTRTLLRRMGGRGVDAKLGVVHRLDKDTSGLMVFARTAQAKRILAAQFRAHTIDRVYHAIAHSAVAAARMDISDVRTATLRSRRNVRLRTSDRSLASWVPRWSNAALKPDASIRFESTYPNSAILWSANACTSATTPARRSKQSVRCFMRGRSDSCIPEPPNVFCSSANRPMTSRRRLNRFDRLAANATAD